MPLVSVIIPTYGHAELILQTLDSVFTQTYQDYEVIVVNDGSPDNTAQILAPLISAGRIQYFEQSNQGVAAARNFGIANSKGKYIALLDDDDLWPPGKLEWQVADIESCDAVLVGGTAGAIGADGSLKAPTECLEESKAYEFEDLFEGSPFLSPGQTLIDRHALELAGGFDSKIWGADDYDLWIGLSQHGQLIRRNMLALYYRNHEGNASRDTIRMIRNIKRVFQKRLPEDLGVKGVRCRSRAYQVLLTYLGKPLIFEIRDGLMTWPPSFKIILKNIKVLTEIFGSQILADQKLRYKIYGAFTRRVSRLLGLECGSADPLGKKVPRSHQ